MILPDPSQPLAPDAAADAFAAIFDGKVEDDELATFLGTLANRGETVDEIVAAATALRARMTAGPHAPRPSMSAAPAAMPSTASTSRPPSRSSSPPVG